MKVEHTVKLGTEDIRKAIKEFIKKEYKSNLDIEKMTIRDIFEDLEEESKALINKEITVHLKEEE